MIGPHRNAHLRHIFLCGDFGSPDAPRLLNKAVRKTDLPAPRLRQAGNGRILKEYLRKAGATPMVLTARQILAFE
jgi:hypothetical protein